MNEYFDRKEIVEKLFVKYKVRQLSQVKMKVSYKVLHIVFIVIEFSMTIVVWDGVKLDMSQWRI